MKVSISVMKLINLRGTHQPPVVLQTFLFDLSNSDSVKELGKLTDKYNNHADIFLTINKVNEIKGTQ